MDIKLKKIILSNFKGIKEKEIEFTDKTNISGDNATGKSTVFDAYSWLLWGKDSLNRKDYEIKPYTEDNEVIHNLESMVEGVFDIDGQEITFKRVYKEVWTKKRGSNNETFTGHTTDFYINEVPKKKSEYESRIGELVSEDEFNLLSNPKYFNEILDKKERRKILLSLVDNLSDDDIIKANPDLKELDLSQYEVDDLKAMAKASSKKINDKLKEIPARIDELEATKTTEDFAALEDVEKELKKNIAKIDDKLAGTNNIGAELQEKYNELSSIKKNINNIKSEFEDEKMNKVNDLKYKIRIKNNDIMSCNSRIDDISQDIKTMQRIIKEHEEEIKETEEELKNLRDNWDELVIQKYDGSFECPTCGQEFPADKKQEIREHFNKDKKLKKARMREEGNRLNEDIKQSEELISYNNSKIKTYEEDISKEKEMLKLELENLENIKAELKEIESESLDNETEKIIEELEKNAAFLEKQIASINQVDRTDLIVQKRTLNERLDAVNNKLSLRGLNSQLDEKIGKYMEEEKELSRIFEENQKTLYLCEQYLKTKAELITDKINGLFNFVEFKLFETLINGSVDDAAEATYKGVPYGSLNTAAQINAGLDVINSLSKHYDKQIPIFVDNAESVNDLMDTDSQLITLTVSKFKNLRVENL